MIVRRVDIIDALAYNIQCSCCGFSISEMGGGVCIETKEGDRTLSKINICTSCLKLASNHIHPKILLDALKGACGCDPAYYGDSITNAFDVLEEFFTEKN
mgnify:CR=1 FL=1